MSVLTRGEYTISPLADGATGRGVSSVVSQYAVSTSKTTVPSDASFSTNRPTWEPGKYVWTRSLITYTSGSPATSTTTPVVSSEWEAVNEIQVGGRNLLRDSGVEVSNGNYNIASYDFTDEIKVGEEVTLTIWGSLATTKTNFRAYNSGGSVSVATLTDNGDGTYSGTFEWAIGSSTNTYLNVYASTNAQTGTSTINKIKLERGNKATDWTPAPEDVDAQIGDVDDRVDGVAADVSGLHTDVDEILAANADRQTAIDAQINSLTQALSSLSTGVDENSTSTQETIDTIQSMIATLEAEKATLAGKIALLEQAKINTDNYIQIGNVKLSNGATVFGVAVGKDVNVLNPDGTISTLERSMTATTANAFLILTGGEQVFDVDATGADAKSFRGESVVIDGAWVETTTPTKGFVLKWGG